MTNENRSGVTLSAALVLLMGVLLFGNFKLDWFAASSPAKSCHDASVNGAFVTYDAGFLPPLSTIKPGARVTDPQTYLELKGGEPATIMSVSIINCGPAALRYLGAMVAGAGRRYPFQDVLLRGYPPTNRHGEFGLVEPVADAKVSPSAGNLNQVQGVELLIGYQIPTQLEGLPHILLNREWVVVNYLIGGHVHTQAFGAHFVVCNPANTMDAQCTRMSRRLFVGQ